MLKTKFKNIFLGFGLWIVQVNSTSIANENVIGYDFYSLPESGIEILRDFSGEPNDDGILATYSISLPDYRKGYYFSSDTRWPRYSNRLIPWVFEKNFSNLFDADERPDPNLRLPNPNGMFALFQLLTGEYLVLLPLAGAETMSWLYVDDKMQLKVKLGTLGKEKVQGNFPLLGWARHEDLYAAIHQTWKKALECEPLQGRVNWRCEKAYPEAFRYLGWCSWEEFRHDIDSELLANAAKEIEKSNAPVRWMLIDDGHQEVKDRKLIRFEPDKSKFPHGWQPLIEQRSEKLKWFGLWHSFNGYWEGIHPDHKLGELNEHLIDVYDDDSTLILPKNNKQAAKAFYERMIGSAKHYGFDFVKIDTQSHQLFYYMGLIDNAVQASARNSQVLEEVCQQMSLGLLNCMAHNPVCLFNTRYSNVSRSSMDYRQENEGLTKTRVYQAYSNTLLFGQTQWTDQDMFHSSDPVLGEVMGIANALSGGPIYVSDAPKDFKSKNIQPLCFDDGELLRPLAPAAPLPDSMFRNAIREKQAYRVIAPLANQSAAIAVYNLNHETNTITTEISPNDYRCTSAMMQPYPGKWDVPEEGLVVYDWHEQRGEKLDEPYQIELQGFSNRLLLLSPIYKGWAVIGRSDKYLSMAAVDEIEYGEDQLTLTLHESGPVVVWSEDGEPELEVHDVEDLGDGFWEVKLPVGKMEYILELKREQFHFAVR